MRPDYLSHPGICRIGGGGGERSVSDILSSRLGAILEQLKPQFGFHDPQHKERLIAEAAGIVLNTGLLEEATTTDCFVLAVRVADHSFKNADDQTAAQIFGRIRQFIDNLLTPGLRDEVRERMANVCLGSYKINEAASIVRGYERKDKLPANLAIADAFLKSGETEKATKTLSVNCVQIAKASPNLMVRTGQLVAIAKKLIDHENTAAAQDVLIMAAADLDNNNLAHFKTLEKIGLMLLDLERGIKALDLLSRGKLSNYYLRNFSSSASRLDLINKSLAAIENQFPEFVARWRQNHSHSCPPPAK